MSTTPAGWYPDSAAPGMVRWWDGERWTDMSVPQDLAPAPPSTSSRVFAAAGVVGKMWFLLLLLAVCVLVIWALV